MTKEHNAKTCLSRCSCKVCNGKNETTLDGYFRKKIAITNDKRLTHDEKNQGGVKCASVNTSTDVISICIFPIKVQYGNSGIALKTHALLESCDQDTFILERLINNLGVKRRNTTITIETLNGEVTNKAMIVNKLNLTSGNCNSHVLLELPDTYTKKRLPVDREVVATPSNQEKHLESIVDKISEKENISVGLSIGVNCAQALEPFYIIPSKYY